MATGHYSRLLPVDEKVDLEGEDEDVGRRVRLAVAVDESKDQSYFLHQVCLTPFLDQHSPLLISQVPNESFSRVLFPLGEINKTKVREIASKIGLPNASRKVCALTQS